MLNLERYRKYTDATYQVSLCGCSMYLRRFNGTWERNKLARTTMQAAREEKVLLLSPSRASDFSFPSLEPLSNRDVSSALEKATLSTRFFTKKPFLREKPW